MSESWRIIDEFPNYSVSSLGKVKNNKTQKILKPQMNVLHKHHQVHLRKDSKTIHQSIHRLVAKAFLPNPENKPEVDHINRCRTDNCVENLRWVTRQENEWNKSFNKLNKLKERHISIDSHWKTKPYTVSMKINNEYCKENFETLEDAIIFRDGLEEFYS